MTELPEKWAEFSKKIQEVKDWVKEAEEVMAAAHARVEPDQNSFDVQSDFQILSQHDTIFNLSHFMLCSDIFLKWVSHCFIL